MPGYHTRHPEKEITDPAELERIASGQRFLTLALCCDNAPYIITVNHVFVPGRRCFYFHCALSGRKLDCIRANPRVCGQVLEDRGYMDGKCDHAYRTVQFEGLASLVADRDEKREALSLLVDRHESDPGPAKARLVRKERLDKVGIVRIDVTALTGKRNG